jgi:hypothetical protein
MALLVVFVIGFCWSKLLISVSGFLLNIGASPERCGASAPFLGHSPRYFNADDIARILRKVSQYVFSRFRGFLGAGCMPGFSFFAL